jgi:hypothetical protein
MFEIVVAFARVVRASIAVVTKGPEAWSKIKEWREPEPEPDIEVYDAGYAYGGKEKRRNK